MRRQRTRTRSIGWADGSRHLLRINHRLHKASPLAPSLIGSRGPAPSWRSNRLRQALETGQGIRPQTPRLFPTRWHNRAIASRMIGKFPQSFLPKPGCLLTWVREMKRARIPREAGRLRPLRLPAIPGQDLGKMVLRPNRTLPFPRGKVMRQTLHWSALDLPSRSPKSTSPRILPNRAVLPDQAILPGKRSCRRNRARCVRYPLKPTAFWTPSSRQKRRNRLIPPFPTGARKLPWRPGARFAPNLFPIRMSCHRIELARRPLPGPCRRP